MKSFNRFRESRVASFNHHAALLVGAALLCVSLGVQADEIEDANKLFKQGQQSQALDKVDAFLANKPKDAQARFLKGLILTEQGKTLDAIKMFSDLTVDYPELPEPYNNLAVLYASQGQYDKARLSLEAAIRTHPSYATAHENLGDIYAKMASQAYDRALQLDSGNTATQTKLAMIQELFAGGTHNTHASKAEKPASTIVAANKSPADASRPATPLASSAPSTPASSHATDDSKEVPKSVLDWAAAWSAQNADEYLSFYADNFKLPEGTTRAEWEAARRERITAPKFIHVDVRIMTVQFADSDHATVKFHQNYKASHLKASGNKTMLMVKSGGKWLIQEERSK